MRRTFWISGLVFILLASTGNAQKIRKSGHHTVIEIEKNFPVSGKGQLHLLGSSADVKVRGWTGNEVAVHQTIRLRRSRRSEAERIARLAESTFSKSGNEIRIDGRRLPRHDISMLYEVRVPRGFALDLDVTGGDISVEEVNGELHARTSGGDIRLQRLGSTVDAATSGGDIDAEHLASEARLRTSGGDISVRRAEQELTVRTSGGDIELRHLKGATVARTSGGDILVIGSLESLRVETSGGDIRVEDAQGPVEATSSGGDLEIIRCAGTVVAKTSGGNILLRRVGETQVRTSGGDVIAESVDVGIQASTSGGDVKLRRVNGYVEGRTSGGDIMAEVTPADYAADHHVELVTSGGNIRLWLPRDLPATIRATIEVRHGDLDAYKLRSDFPIHVTRQPQRGHTRRGEIRGEGDLNGGGDLIELRTVEGDIEIRSLP